MSTTGNAIHKLSTSHFTEFYELEICELSDVVFRFYLCIYLDIQKAQDKTEEFYMDFAKKISDLKLLKETDDGYEPSLLALAWTRVKDVKNIPTKISNKTIAKVFSPLSPEERLYFCLVDILGYSMQNIKNLFNVQDDIIRNALKKSRQSLLQHIQNMNDAYMSTLPYLHEWVNQDSSSQGPSQIYTQVKDQPEFQFILDQYKQSLGQLQLALQSFYLSNKQKQTLKSFIRDDQTRATFELMDIQSVEKEEVWSGVMRRLFFVLFTVGVLWFAYTEFAPQKKPAFKALDYITYEALAMEDDPTGRISLPTKDMNEIHNFLAQAKNLGFTPKVLNFSSLGWEPVGVSVLDYETTIVAVVQYRNTSNQENMFYFAYQGKLNDLPNSKAFQISNQSFHAYATDKLNVIAFEQESNTVSFLVGHKSVQELAETTAKTIIGKF